MPIHQVRVQNLALAPTLTALCAGYELGEWRARQLADDVFGRHLTSFALSFTDWQSIDGDTAARMLKKAAHAVYTTQKYKRRGEFGELLLHAAAKDFFGAVPAVSKIHFKDSPNDTVKGFDCVHVVSRGDELELWLGEVKYYKSLSKAIKDSTDELKAHLDAGFLRKEFIAITNKLDPNAPSTEAVANLLEEANSLDQILRHLVIPVMLTYDSPSVAGHTVDSDEYRVALEAEVASAWEAFELQMDIEHPVTLHLILVPLESKERLTNLFQQKLQVWQHL